MAYLPFYVTTTSASGNVSLPDLGNRTLPNSLTNYDLGQEFQIEEIRYSKSLAEAIYNDGWTAEDYLGNAITAQASLSLTEELLNKAGHVLTTDDLPEGTVNKFYDDSLVANFISVAPGSTQYLGFNPTTGEISVKALAISTVTVDATYSSLSLWVASEYVGSPLPYQESDVIILTAATGGIKTYINNGGNLGTSADWTLIEQPQLTDTYIRALFTGGDGIAYDNITGDFDIDLATNSGLYFSTGKLSIQPDNTTGVTVVPINLTGNGAGVLIDNSTIEHSAGTLRIKADGVNDTHIDWGTGVNQVNAEDLPLTTHVWLNIVTPTDVQDAVEKLDAALTTAGKKSWSWGAASNAASNTNRYLDKFDGVATNQSPYVAWFNCKLRAISLSTNSASTWTAEVRVNGVAASTLSSGGNQYAQTSGLNISINAGDRVSFYVNGTGVNRPSIDALFEEA